MSLSEIDCFQVQQHAISKIVSTSILNVKEKFLITSRSRMELSRISAHFLETNLLLSLENLSILIIFFFLTIGDETTLIFPKLLIAYKIPELSCVPIGDVIMSSNTPISSDLPIERFFFLWFGVENPLLFPLSKALIFSFFLREIVPLFLFGV